MYTTVYPSQAKPSQAKPTADESQPQQQQQQQQQQAQASAQCSVLSAGAHLRGGGLTAGNVQMCARRNNADGPLSPDDTAA